MKINIDFLIYFTIIISMVGTLAGAFIGVIINNPSQKTLGNIIGFAGGLMLSIVVFDLIPESLNWSFKGTIIYSVFGILIFYLLDIIYGFFNLNQDKKLKNAIMASIGIMIHNFPEGIIMGCGFCAGENLGIKMAIVIAIHDIPEGIAVAAPMMATNMKKWKIILYAFVTALPTALGAVLGIYLGNISTNGIGKLLAIASGIMLFVVCDEMLPESSNLWEGKSRTFGTLLGIILGLVITNIL